MSNVANYRSLAEQFTRLADGIESADGLFSGRIVLITETLIDAGWDFLDEPCLNCACAGNRCGRGAGSIKCCPDCTHKESRS